MMLAWDFFFPSCNVPLIREGSDWEDIHSSIPSFLIACLKGSRASVPAPSHVWSRLTELQVLENESFVLTSPTMSPKAPILVWLYSHMMEDWAISPQKSEVLIAQCKGSIIVSFKVNVTISSSTCKHLSGLPHSSQLLLVSSRHHPAYRRLVGSTTTVTVPDGTSWSAEATYVERCKNSGRSFSVLQKTSNSIWVCGVWAWTQGFCSQSNVL